MDPAPEMLGNMMVPPDKTVDLLTVTGTCAVAGKRRAQMMLATVMGIFLMKNGGGGLWGGLVKQTFVFLTDFFRGHPCQVANGLPWIGGGA